MSKTSSNKIDAIRIKFQNIFYFNILDEISEDIEEPDEVKHAWDELAILQREQQRYSDIKLDLHQDLEDYRKRQKHLEDVRQLICF